MRVRDHIALSTAGALLLRPWLGRGVLGLWAGGVLIDADHYVWFCVRRRSLNPAAAVRLFNEAHGPSGRATRALHSPAALLAFLLAGLRRPALLPLALGMAVHVALDAGHDARMDRTRAAALERDRFTCRACGRRAPGVGTHLRRQPWLLPSYRAHNLVSLCGPCHEAAHESEGRAASWS
jgi:hypothetical protein